VSPDILGGVYPASRRDGEPPPATVVMILLEEILRMRALPVSALKRFPALSTATALGPVNCALMAGPPSPEDPGEPLPASVVMIPSEETLRMRGFSESAKKRFPAPSTATPSGRDNWALMAGPPSPGYADH